MYNPLKPFATRLLKWQKRKLNSPLKIRLLVFIHDICMIPIAWGFAYWLRFNLGTVNPVFIHQAIQVLPIVVFTQIIFYWGFSLYRGIWRFASITDLIRIMKTVMAGAVTTMIILFLSAKLVSIPRSIFPLYALLLIVFLGGSRFIYRLLKNYADDQSHSLPLQRVLIVGAGQAGEGIVRDLLRHTEKEYHVVAFVDDSAAKIGQEIHGIRVLGESSDIPALVKQYNIHLVMIAMPSAGSTQMRPIVEYCEQAKIPFRTLPSLQDLAHGHIKVDALRAVSLEDLLGRDPVSLDWANIRTAIVDQSILISGGGGSIGTELCRQIAHFSPKKLFVIEQNEFNLYTLMHELSARFPQLNFSGHLLNVTDQIGLQSIFEKNQIDIVFHAAAYKHVPMLENQRRVAINNNILGTKILVEAAVKADVKKFILISTDKAVNPTNIMGSTKRIAELFCQNYPQIDPLSKTQFMTVRFGNVLGSAGSVIPLFKKQIASGGPITVTHPDISRFFMTIPEATQLILQSTIMGTGGEIFVLDMGEPIKINYLAEQMIHLAGLTPHQDIAIQYIGLRSGEKLHEELFYAAEPLEPTTHEKIMKTQCRPMNAARLMTLLKALEIACQKNDEQQMSNCIMQLVPEYTALT